MWDEKKLEIEAMEGIRTQLKNRITQEICGNATVEMKPESIEFDVGGCKGLRRNGSKYCQDCSDKWNNKDE